MRLQDLGGGKETWLDWTVGEVTRFRPLGLVFLVSASHEFGAYEVETRTDVI